MAEFKQRKTLHKDLDRIRLSESDLRHIGTSVEKLANKYGGEVEIEVVSGDGEDTFQTRIPEFFTSEEMPTYVGSIEISYRHYESPVSCSIELPSKWSGHARIVVGGNEPALVSGIFREIEREFNLRRSPFAFLPKHDNGLFVFLLSVLVASAIFSAFDIIFEIAMGTVAGFRGSTLYYVILAVGWSCVGLSLFWGPILIPEKMKRYFPAVEYYGQLTDPGSADRSRIIWFAVVILLPIVLNVFQGVLTDALSLSTK